MSNIPIKKIIGTFLLTVIFYMHLCSAACATGLGSFCGKTGNEKGNQKSCCKHKSNGQSKGHGCQEMHFAFFNTSGKFFQGNHDVTFNLLHSLVVILPPHCVFIPAIQNPGTFSYHLFHPPPNLKDIRLLISSLLI